MRIHLERISIILCKSHVKCAEPMTLGDQTLSLNELNIILAAQGRSILYSHLSVIHCSIVPTVLSPRNIHFKQDLIERTIIYSSNSTGGLVPSYIWIRFFPKFIHLKEKNWLTFDGGIKIFSWWLLIDCVYGLYAVHYNDDLKYK